MHVGPRGLRHVTPIGAQHHRDRHLYRRGRSGDYRRPRHGSIVIRILVSLLCGGLFGGGLVVSGMTDTLRVQGFLDLFGGWDPTLMFVMGGAIITMFFAWRSAANREAAVLGGPLPTPPSTQIDTRLAVGGIMFGMGWGLSGFCPGPAFASLSFGGSGGLIFMVAMLAAMFAARPIIGMIFRGA